MPQLTLTFVVFAAVATLAFWLAPRRHRPPVLTLEGALLLAWLDLVALAFLIVMAWLVERGGRRRELGRIDLVIVALVAIFILVRIGQRADVWFGLPAIIAPAGFGFSMLRLVHYRVERARGTLAPHDLHAVVRYLLFFPTIAVGPIHRMDDFLRSEARHRWDAERAARGLRRILLGYFKVVVLANWAVYNQDLFVSGLDSALGAWLFESLQYGLYLYLAFAGYSDIAIGLGALLGYDIVENFRYPFLQPNLGAFWRSWHMSLSDWCRRYVFLPALARWRRPGPALFVAMIVLGLWHELTLRFFAWGAWHALGLTAWRAWQRRRPPRSGRSSSPWTRTLVYVLSVLATFTWVVLGFTLIKEPSLGALWDTLRALASPTELP